MNIVWSNTPPLLPNRRMVGVQAQKRGAVPRMATMSEFDSGLDGLARLLSKKKMDQAKKHNHIRTNKGGTAASFNTTTKNKYANKKKIKSKKAAKSRN